MRYRYLSEASFEGIVMSEKGIMLDANSQMANMLGYESAQQLSDRSVSEIIAAMRLGVSDFIVKPFNAERILSAVEKATNGVVMRPEQGVRK